MDERERGKLSTLLEDARAGRAGAREELFVAVYDEMHRMAREMFRRERPGTLLQPTALVNEAVVRILKGGALEWAGDRRDLFAAVALAMRRTLVEYARKLPRGQRVDLPLEKIVAGLQIMDLDLVALDEELERLIRINERPGLVVVLKFFGGMTIAQMAEVLGVSEATVESDWRYARAWIRERLRGDV